MMARMLSRIHVGGSYHDEFLLANVFVLADARPKTRLQSFLLGYKQKSKKDSVNIQQRVFASGHPPNY
jgi:hypothetical protein